MTKDQMDLKNKECKDELNEAKVKFNSIDPEQEEGTNFIKQMEHY